MTSAPEGQPRNLDYLQCIATGCRVIVQLRRQPAYNLLRTCMHQLQTLQAPLEHRRSNLSVSRQVLGTYRTLFCQLLLCCTGDQGFRNPACPGLQHATADFRHHFRFAMAVVWTMSSAMNGFCCHSQGFDADITAAKQAHLLSPSQRLLPHRVQQGFREQHAQHSAHGTLARRRQRLLHRAFRSSTVCAAVAGECAAATCSTHAI
jgi:hypothetical protein